MAHAVSDSPLGPYKFHDLALPARGDKFWDGMNTHNPTIHRFNEKYYLYYTGNRGDTLENKFALNVSHRNNQRIGVAVSSSPYGPWQRFDHPIIDVSEDSTAPDAKMTANPSVTKMKDGRYLMVYKAVGKKTKGIWGGPVVHLCAIADRPDGPFVKHLSPIFTSPGVEFPAEDPYVWLQDGTYYAIVKDMKGHFTHAGRSLALFYSDDGQIWQPTNDCLITTPEINWNDGTISPMKHLERPQLLFDDRNHPIALFLAADSMADYTKEEGTSFNVSIPIQGEKRLKMKGHLNERNVQSTPNH